MILSFKNTFVPAVVAGTKPHTIRAGRRWRQGMSIQFYQNARQKSMTKIRPDAVATLVQEIRIERESQQYRNTSGSIIWPAIHIDGRELKPYEMQQLAQNDRFDHVAQMVEFFDNTAGLPFTGQLIRWSEREPAELVRRIRITLFGHCAGEDLAYREGEDNDWVIAAMLALDDVCEVMEKHFPELVDAD